MALLLGRYEARWSKIQALLAQLLGNLLICSGNTRVRSLNLTDNIPNAPKCNASKVTRSCICRYIRSTKINAHNCYDVETPAASFHTKRYNNRFIERNQAFAYLICVVVSVKVAKETTSSIKFIKVSRRKNRHRSVSHSMNPNFKLVLLPFEARTGWTTRYRVSSTAIRFRVIQMTLLPDKSSNYKVYLLTFLSAQRPIASRCTYNIKLKGMVNRSGSGLPRELARIGQPILLKD